MVKDNHIFIFEPKHLQQVVDLHYKVLNWSINSRLGKDHIYNLYNALLSDKNSFGLVYINNNKLLGFFTGTTNYNETARIIKSQFGFKLILKLLFHAIKNPMVMIDLVENAFFIPKVKKSIPTTTEGLSLVTDIGDPMGGFAAMALWKAFNTYCKEKGINMWVGQVAKYDIKPNQLYKIYKAKLIKSLIRNNIYIVNIGRESRS